MNEMAVTVERTDAREWSDEQNPVGGGWGIPVHWDSTVAGLPTGYTDAMGPWSRGGSKAAAWPGQCLRSCATPPWRPA